MTPEQRYTADLAQGHIQPDALQAQRVQDLQQVYQHLCQRYCQDLPWWRRAWHRWMARTRPSTKGLYLWGSVGIGKTYLMDLLFTQLPLQHKQRWHFHDFMQHIHQQLQTLQGVANPLTQIAKRIARQARVLCLDEFLVHDIGDAMILAGLLEALFAQHVTVITTSNTAPQQLYQHGLQRQRFLPAIELLTQHCRVIHATANHDYRLQHVLSRGVFFAPLTADTDQQLYKLFQLYSHHQTLQPAHICIAERLIPTRALAAQIIWFDFDVICSSPRNQADYLQIAQQFNVFILSNVPAIAEHQHHRITYFIHLIDILYDANVELILSSTVSLPDIYPRGNLLDTFQRTLSRLHEMQSPHYLHRCNQTFD